MRRVAQRCTLSELTPSRNQHTRLHPRPKRAYLHPQFAVIALISKGHVNCTGFPHPFGRLYRSHRSDGVWRMLRGDQRHASGLPGWLLRSENTPTLVSVDTAQAHT